MFQPQIDHARPDEVIDQRNCALLGLVSIEQGSMAMARYGMLL